MLTLNQQIQHQIDLERYKTGLSKQVATRVNEVADEVLALLATVPDNNNGIKSALSKIDRMIDTTFDSIQTDFLEQIKELLEAEITFLVKHSEVELTEEEKKSLIAPIFSLLILGLTLDQHNRAIKDSIKRNIRGRILAAKQNNIKLLIQVKALRGTALRKYKDGVWNRGINGLATILDTALSTYINNLQMELLKADGVEKYRWISVLDSHTSAICRARSNKVFVVGQGPVPPAHARCRSGIRPYISEENTNISYSEWLRQQPRAVVEEVLGKGKANLFLKNEISLDKFVTQTGRELTIEELKAKLNQ